MPLDSSSSGANADRDEFIVFSVDGECRQVLSALAAERDWPIENVLSGGVDEAVAALSDMVTPRRLVIDLGSATDPISDVNRLAEVCDPGTRVIALGNVNDVSLFRDLIGVGVSDYLLKPVTAEALRNAFDRVETPDPAPEANASEGKIILTIGARGGIGASTVAVNAAWIMAHNHRLKTALVDLDLRFGTTALTLDLETGGGLVDALHNPDRLDGLFIERAMVRESENLYVLGSEEALDDQVGFDSRALDMLAERLRGDFPRVVFDVPRYEACEHPGLLTTADTIVVVSDLSLAGMRDTLRLLRLAGAAAPDARLVVAANRVGAAKKGEIPKADFAKGIERPVDFEIPFDPKSHVAAVVAGKALPLVAKRGPSVVALNELVADIADIGEREEPKLTGLFRRKPKKAEKKRVEPK